MKTNKLIFLASILTILLSAYGFSAPSRTLGSVYGDTPRAQWFMGFGDLSPSMLTAELYDNISQNENVPGWGGGPNGYQAINGFVRDIFYDTFGNISSFSVTAIVANDGYDYAGTLQGTAAQNDLNQYAGDIVGQSVRPMYGTVLAADFADSGILPFPSSNVRAVNYDALAWRGKSQSEPPATNDILGSYSIPVWNFGDIAPGAWVTRELQFALYRHEAPGSALYNLLLSSQQEHLDILSNRTSSLKANSRPAPLFVDDGTAIPGPGTANGGNASVYFDDRLGASVKYTAGAPADQTWFPAMASSPVMLPFYIELDNPNAYVHSITFKATGTGDDCADIDSVQVWIDYDANGKINYWDKQVEGFKFWEDNGEVTISTDGIWGDTPPPPPPFVAEQNGSTTPALLLAYRMSPNAPAGKTYSIAVTGMAVTSETGAPLEASGIPLAGATLTTEKDPPHILVRLGDYNPQRHSWWNDRGAIDTEMLQVLLDANSDSDIMIDSLDLIGTDTSYSESDVDTLKVFVDENGNGKIDVGDTLLGEAGNAIECSVPVGGYVLPARSSKNLLLAYKMKPGVMNPQARAYMCGINHINAHTVGATENVAVMGLEVMSDTLYALSQLPTIAAAGNDFYPLRDHEWWESVSNENCPVAQLQVSNTGDEQTTIDHITITASGAGNDATDIEEADLWLDADFNGTIDHNDLLIAKGSFSADDGTCTFDTSVYMEPGSYDWYGITYKMRPGTTPKPTFHADVTDVQGHTDWMDAPVLCNGLPVAGVTVTMVENPPSLAISKGESSPMGRVWWGELGVQPQELLQLHIRSDADRDIWINEFKLKILGYQMYYSDISSVSVFRDGNSNGVIDSDDSEICSTSSVLYGPEFSFGPTSVDRAVIRARSSADYIIAVSMDPNYARYHYDDYYRISLTGIDARWVDDNEAAPYYGLPIDSCRLSIGDQPSKLKIGQAKLSYYGDQWVQFQSVDVTSNGVDGYFVQETDKSAGIAVVNGSKLKRGDRISIIGKYRYSYGSSPCVEEAEIRIIERGRTITPLSMPNKATGGGEWGTERAVRNYIGADGQDVFAIGLNNLGLLVRTTGKVTGKKDSNTFYIDDGSGLMDGYTDMEGNPLTGMAVFCSSESMVPENGAYVAVTGIMTQQYGTRRLVPRDANDIVILKTAE